MMKVFIPMYILSIMSKWPSSYMQLSLWGLLVSLLLLYQGSSGLGFSMTLDSWSWWMMWLSLWITTLCFLGSFQIWGLKINPSFNLVLWLLLLALFHVFSCMYMILLFFWLEVALIVTLVLIGQWGSQGERYTSAMYLLFYTLTGSFPLLGSICWLHNTYNSWNLLEWHFMLNYLGSWMWYLTSLAFCIKLPLFLVHYWLPKAHVEAPLVGSMMLAGVLLKLGGYGLFRFIPFMEVKSSWYYFYSLSLIGGCWSSWLCFRQVDVKALIAFSSIGHMGLVMSGCLSEWELGWWGSWMLMIGHGLCSSGLFCWATFYYERCFSRNIWLLQGLINLSPSFAMWGFLLCSSNLSAPPSLNCWAEISLMIVLINQSNHLCFMFLLLFMLTGAYSVFLYSILVHGEIDNSWPSEPLLMREAVLLMFHWVPLNCIFFMF